MGIESNPRNRRLDSRGAGLRQPSNSWIEFDGISRHKKLLDSNANFEEFVHRNTNDPDWCEQSGPVLEHAAVACH